MDEAALVALHEKGARRELVTALLERYGPEILSYLLATLREGSDAGEAFSLFTFNLWQASESFRGESSFRTWAYALARHAMGRIYRERGKRRRQVPLSGAPEVDAMAERIRSGTEECLRSEKRSTLHALRAALDPDDQTILILRVDRKLEWPDIARVMADEKTVSVVALRKRFERIKEKLRRRAADLSHT